MGIDLFPSQPSLPFPERPLNLVVLVVLATYNELWVFEKGLNLNSVGVIMTFNEKNGIYTFPGGKMNNQDSADSSLDEISNAGLRELEEETGLQLPRVRFKAHKTEIFHMSNFIAGILTGFVFPEQMSQFETPESFLEEWRMYSILDLFTFARQNKFPLKLLSNKAFYTPMLTACAEVYNTTLPSSVARGNQGYVLDILIRQYEEQLESLEASLGLNH